MNMASQLFARKGSLKYYSELETRYVLKIVIWWIKFPPGFRITMKK